MKIDQVKQLDIPTGPGCYRYINGKGEIIYVGKASNLKSRVLSYWQKSADLPPVKNSMLSQVERIRWIETDSEIEALLLEANLIKKYQPAFNVLMRDDKRYAYIKISTEDEIPGVFITRKIDKQGKYFGPFISALAVRQTLKAIRKIFPYCTARKIQARPCFYYQIDLCKGVCGGKITNPQYLKEVIKPLMLFLSGGKKQIVKGMEKEIKKLEVRSKSLEKQIAKSETQDVDELTVMRRQAGLLKYQLANMKQVLEHANIVGLIDKYANDVVELAKLLNLERVPERIEGYDISNIFGQEAVGSMVVFSGGEPDKNEYRKFKIRAGIPESEMNLSVKRGDVQMLAEVLSRRFKRSAGSDQGEDWPLPDLIIIDGGKAQLNAAVRILRQYELNIMIIAISKGRGLRSAMAPDKLFFPGQKNPLELTLASPALHLIKRVRDEAHRFAINYHRKLRSKIKI